MLQVGDKIQWLTWYDEKICFMSGKITHIYEDFVEVIGKDLTGKYTLKDTLSMDDRSVKNAEIGMY